MRLELTRVGLLVKLANHYTTRGAYSNNEKWNKISILSFIFKKVQIQKNKQKTPLHFKLWHMIKHIIG